MTYVSDKKQEEVFFQSDSWLLHWIKYNNTCSHCFPGASTAIYIPYCCDITHLPILDTPQTQAPHALSSCILKISPVVLTHSIWPLWLSSTHWVPFLSILRGGLNVSNYHVLITTSCLLWKKKIGLWRLSPVWLPPCCTRSLHPLCGRHWVYRVATKVCVGRAYLSCKFSEVEFWLLSLSVFMPDLPHQITSS